MPLMGYGTDATGYPANLAVFLGEFVVHATAAQTMLAADLQYKRSLMFGLSVESDFLRVHSMPGLFYLLPSNPIITPS